GLAGELHVGIDLDLHRAAGFLVDLLRPRKEMARLVWRLRTGERMHLEQDLRMRGKAERCERGDGDGFHGHSLELIAECKTKIGADGDAQPHVPGRYRQRAALPRLAPGRAA